MDVRSALCENRCSTPCRRPGRHSARCIYALNISPPRHRPSGWAGVCLWTALTAASYRKDGTLGDRSNHSNHSNHSFKQ
ncbi:hypothetical protein BDV10DRAFT_163573 [Aspergillus recurvatus]